MKRGIPLAIGLLLTATLPVAAHEEGVIRLASSELTVGEALEVRGEKLPKSTALRLELRGALETFALGEVRTDAAGAFASRLALPDGATPGAYTVVALASDGDAVARAELMLRAAPAVAADDAAGEHEHAEATAAPQATAAMMDLPVQTGPGEWVAILGFIAFGLAGGLALVRPAARG